MDVELKHLARLRRQIAMQSGGAAMKDASQWQAKLLKAVVAMSSVSLDHELVRMRELLATRSIDLEQSLL